MSRLRVLSLVLIAALATACGSTVQLNGGGAVDAAGNPVAGADGLGGDPLGAGGGPGGSTGAAGTTGGTGTPGLAGGGTSGGGTAGGATGGGATGGGTSGSVAGGRAGTGRGGPSGPGVTADKVYIGLIFDKSAGAVNEAAGVGAVTSGNSKANNKAIIDDINKRGGVGGRTLVPVYAEVDQTSSQTLDQQYSAVCQKFTRDSPRVFVAQDAGPVESYRECMATAGVPILSNSLPTLGAAQFARYSALIEQGYPNVDRLAAYQVTPLVDQKYFTPWNTVTGQPAATGAVKVGILTYDDKVFSPAVRNILKPALERLGFAVEVAEIKQIANAAGYGEQGAAVKSAQLTFASRGVTHVIPFESNGGLSTLFLPTARSQNYYPRYGISSATGYEALRQTGIADNRQFNGAVGYGWIPALDLNAGLNKVDGPYSNPQRRYCLKVMKDAGITFDSGNAEAIALNSCADFYLLKVALDKTPGLITASTLVRTVEALGTSYQKAGTVGQEFRPGRRDPSNKAYYWRFFPDCPCFKYVGGLRTIP